MNRSRPRIPASLAVQAGRAVTRTYQDDPDFDPDDARLHAYNDYRVAASRTIARSIRRRRDLRRAGVFVGSDQTQDYRVAILSTVLGAARDCRGLVGLATNLADCVYYIRPQFAPPEVGTDVNDLWDALACIGRRVFPRTLTLDVGDGISVHGNLYGLEGPYVLRLVGVRGSSLRGDPDAWADQQWAAEADGWGADAEHLETFAVWQPESGRFPQTTDALGQTSRECFVSTTLTSPDGPAEHDLVYMGRVGDPYPPERCTRELPRIAYVDEADDIYARGQRWS